MADPYWNMFCYLQQENALMKEKFNDLHKMFGEILEAMKYSLDKKNDKEKKLKVRCKFYNKGFCREGSACDYSHPAEDCVEHCSTGSCSQERFCPYRHPNKCKFWSSGKCWRESNCVYLHKSEDLGCAEEHEESVVDSDKENEFENNDDNDVEIVENDDEVIDDIPEVCDGITEYLKDTSKAISTEEIIKMYENVEFDVNDKDQISTDEILKMYDTEESIENSSIDIKKSTRKLKNKRIY
jgi:hypothetical protein